MQLFNKEQPSKSLAKKMAFDIVEILEIPLL